MKRNRKIPKKMSVIATTTMRFGAIIVFFFLMVILNQLSSSSCTQLLKEKGEKERELAKLEDARMRESTRWEEMKTPERIEEALSHHALPMRIPRADQTVRMRPNGTPFPSQLAVVRARQRSGVMTAGQPRVERAEPTVRSKYRRHRSR